MSKYKLKGFRKPKAMCKCCKLEYGFGSVFGGLTISLTKKDYPDNCVCIDIPYEELKNLKLVIKDRIKNG